MSDYAKPCDNVHLAGEYIVANIQSSFLMLISYELLCYKFLSGFVMSHNKARIRKFPVEICMHFLKFPWTVRGLSFLDVLALSFRVALSFTRLP